MKGYINTECQDCGNPLKDITKEHCEECRNKSEVVDAVRYTISILERGLRATQQRDLPGLRASLRDARHEIQDLEKLIR